jgi:PAS domain S-box-containing protein
MHRVSTAKERPYLDHTNGRLDHIFKAIEIAKKEWEKTIDCVSDMIILTDSDGVIKRVNKAVTDFTGKTYQSIIGMTWEDLIVEHELEATTLYAGYTELRHKKSGRWFELNAHPFDDSELGFSGSVLTIHDITEAKNMTKSLEQSRNKLDKNRKSLQKALDKICSLIQSVIQLKDNSVRFYNPHLIKCYEALNCEKKDCPCHGKEPVRCWQVAGTFCNGTSQGAVTEKYGSCSKCTVYKQATSDPAYQIGEHFNNMMHALEHNRQ